MGNTVHIFSASNSVRLIFSDPKPPGQRYSVASITVELRDRDFSIQSPVYLYQSDSLVQFFAHLATLADKGSVNWQSIEHHLELQASVETDQILLQVTLRPEGNTGEVQMLLGLERGQLGAIAQQVQQLLHA